MYTSIRPKFFATSATDLEFDFEDGRVARPLGQVGVLGLPLRIRIHHGVRALAEGHRLDVHLKIGAPLKVTVVAICILLMLVFFFT